MDSNVANISRAARFAAQRSDWARVGAAADEIIRRDENSPEGHFLRGLVEKVSQRPLKAVAAFEKALSLDSRRYDAAIELSDQLILFRRNSEAKALIDKYRSHLNNSPRYLDMAATVLSNIGLHAEAWPLYQRANKLQPDIELFQANLAACGVFLGKIEESKTIYEKLLAKKPWHQRNHQQLSRLESATDSRHIHQMLSLLHSTNLPPDKNIFLYYALGKEYEDLEDWENAFLYYKKAGDAVDSVANYSFANDKAIIDTIIAVCTEDWLRSCPAKALSGAARASRQVAASSALRASLSNAPTDASAAPPQSARHAAQRSMPSATPSIAADKTPIFVLGLPRTGTTLAERIISSHSMVQSVGETDYIEFVLKRESGIQTADRVNTAIIERAAEADIGNIANGYLECVRYALADEPLFIDKLPYNFFYIGFIAKAFPNAKIVHLNRQPLDACFSIYKQVFTWAYKFSYTLENIGKFFIAYTGLMNHWRSLLGDRLIELNYESLVTDQEKQTCILLDKLCLEFEASCLNFEKNKAASATASSVQVREKIHRRSINKWKKFERQLAPLKAQLENAGIEIH